MVRPVVITKEGWIQGVKLTSRTGKCILYFKGIPYAEPPVGELRFQDPQPMKPWTGVKQAMKEGAQCMQLDTISQEIEGDEDCLYLNVATPSLEDGLDLRPVMVWIHGGGFMWGNGGTDLYSPDYIVKHDIVYVSMNYRLGVFGFLALDHEAAPGNMGLKDQVAALRWVKENILKFGGDPNNITIFGESAGSASVHYHLLSPMSKGLFHKAIAQSGVAINPWARAFKTAEIGERLAADLGKKTSHPSEIVKYLRTIPAHELADAQRKILTPMEVATVGFPFAPTVDSESREPFLPREPYELIPESSDIPLMLGYNSHEGTITIIGFTDQVYPVLDAHFPQLIYRAVFNKPISEIPGAPEKIRKYYFGDKKITPETLNEYTQCMGDYYFVVGIHEIVDSRLQMKSPTYLYRFSHDAPVKLSTTLWKTEVKGAGHFDEISYLFYQRKFRNIPFITPGSVEQVVSDRFVKMWTDFAKTGNPTPEVDDLITAKWEPVTDTEKNYLSINSELTAGVNPNEEIWNFWKSFHNNADNVK